MTLFCSFSQLHYTLLKGLLSRPHLYLSSEHNQMKMFFAVDNCFNHGCILLKEVERFCPVYARTRYLRRCEYFPIFNDRFSRWIWVIRYQRMPPSFWILMELYKLMDDTSGGDNRSYKTCRAPVALSCTISRTVPAICRPDTCPVVQPTASEH